MALKPKCEAFCANGRPQGRNADRQGAVGIG